MFDWVLNTSLVFSTSTTLQVFTSGVEEAKTNVLVKQECITNPTFDKTKKWFENMGCFNKIQISTSQTNEIATINLF